jgi:hypothetical protein
VTRRPVFQPRGTVTFPRPMWKIGARVRMIGSGWEGTVTGVARRGADYGVTVRWDKSGAEGRVVAAAFDLEPLA